jgi:putative phosphotransacetylase
MGKPDIEGIIKKSIIQALAAKNQYYVPAAASNRHIHLSQEALETLFGKNYVLTKMRLLSQPDQYACEEKVALIGPKGTIKGIRVLGPVRPDTQVEITVTDSFALGLPPVVRMSGDVKGTPGGRLAGPNGEYELPCGLIVSRRHMHASTEQAAWFGLKNGDVIRVRKSGLRPIVFEDVVVRAGSGHELELHIDTDEANAAFIKNGDLLELVI